MFRTVQRTIYALKYIYGMNVVQIALNVVLAALIGARFWDNWVLHLHVCVALASAPLLLILLSYTTESTALLQFDHWSVALPTVALLLVFYLKEYADGIVVGSFLLALWIFCDAKRAREPKDSNWRKGTLPPLLGLLGWAVYSLYDDRFIPWGTVWMPSMIVFAYFANRLLQSLVSFARKNTAQDDFASVLFVVVIAYAILAQPRDVTDCRQADNDSCGFGSSMRGTGTPIANGCKCLTSDWLPVDPNSTGGAFDICLLCGSNHTQRTGTDCCGVPLTTKLLGLLNCIEEGRDRCACGTSGNAAYNNETNTYTCLY